MRRQLNLRFLACLLVALVVLGTGTHFLHGFQARRNAHFLSARAERARDEGKPEQAAEFWRRYLAYAPGDTAALAEYALTLEKTARTSNDYVQVLTSFQEVLERDPGRGDVRRRAAELSMALEQYTAAAVHFEALLPSAAGPAEVELMLARCREANGEFARAAEGYARAARHDPARIEAFARRAYLLQRRLGRPEQAAEAADEMVRANARSFRAYLARARFRQEFGPADGAAADVSEARRLAPDEAEVLLAAADLALARGGPDEARGLLERGKGLHAKDARFPQALARLSLRAGKHREAVELLRQSLAVVPDRAEDVWSLADVLIDVGELAEARGLVARLRDAGSSPALIDYLEARALIREGRWAPATETLERARPLLAREPELAKHADLLLARCFEQLGNPDLQTAAYRRALGIDPLWAPARLGLAAALASSNRLDEAAAEFEAAAARAPEARLPLARLLILRNARLPARQRDWRPAERVLDEAERAAPGSEDVQALRAELLAAQDRPDDARRLLESLRRKHPKNPALWAALANLAERQGGPQKVQALLDELAREAGDGADLRLLRADHLARGGAAARPALAALERDPETVPAPDRPRLWFGLANAYFRVGDTGQAARLWRMAADQRPDDLWVRVLLFDAVLLSGDEAGAAGLAKEIRRLEGESGSCWRYAEAARLVLAARRGSAAGLDRARLLLAEAAARRPSWPRVHALEAALEEVRANPDAAIRAYRKAFDLGDRRPEVLRRLVQLLYERRRYADADDVVAQLQAAGPVVGELGKLATEISLHNQDRTRALELARQAVSAESPSYMDHVGLGQVLRAVGQPEEAEKRFRHALKLADQVPETWVALVLHLARAGKGGEAEALLADARRRLAPDRAPLALAFCHDALGQKQKAEEQYDAAVKARPDDVTVVQSAANFHLRAGARAKAEPLLRRLLDPALKAPAEAAASARRNLARVLAGGGYRQFLEAMALLDQNGKGPDAAAEDQRARAAVLATRGERRREAIRLFEGLLSRQAARSEDRLTLARLYEAERDGANARQQLLALVSAGDDNPVYLAYYVSHLLRRNQDGEAAAWLRRLEQREPKSWRTLELKARLLRARGEGAALADLVRDHAREPGADAVRAAALLEELGQPAAAEALFRKHHAESGKPRSGLPLAEFLGRQRRTAEALDLCEAAWREGPAEAVAAACVNVLYAGPADDAQRARVSRRLDAALGDRPASTGLLHARAALSNLDGDYAGAAGLYRRVLERDSDDLLALNNLAWLAGLKERRTDEALGLLRRGVELAGPTAELLDTRGVVYLAAGRGDEAARDLEAVLAQAPTAARWFHLAQARLAARDRASARDAFAKAKATGLTEGDLHPLEHEAYRQALALLGPK